MAPERLSFPTLRTPRLVLRPWREDDRPLFAEINADPRVAEHLPGVLTREESDALFDRIQAHIATNGFGLWAVEAPGVTPLLGFIGLARPTYEAHFTPCVEVGWRLGSGCWGLGLATEGARAALAFGFGELGLAEIVSFTSPLNQRSRRVMEKLGMIYDAQGDFDHPRLPEGHRLRRHVLYRLAKTQFTDLPAATR